MHNLAGVLVLVGLVAAAAVPPAPAQGEDADAAFRESVRELLQATGGADLGQQMADAMSGQMLDAMRGTSTRVPPRAIEITREVISREYEAIFGDEERLLDLYGPIYRKHFTKAELDTINAFYRTPVGQKAVRTMPGVLDESLALGQRLSQGRLPRILEQIQQRLEEEGLVPR